VEGIDGKVAVVTGAARGIGRAIAETFNAAGATVVIADRDGEGGRNTAATLGGATEAVEVDVRDWAAVDTAFAGVAERHGRVDICVNNAGITAIAPSLELDEAAWRDVLDVNLSGVFGCAQAAGRHMARTGGGTIVNIASAAGVLALPERAPYCASKGAVISLTRVLAVEWAKLGIRVNAIGPGWVKTDFVQAAIDDGHLAEADIRRRTPLDRLATPAEIAQVALFLVSPAASYITGQTVFPDGGFTSYGSWQ
jgi:NAD(P)-dependent dehydrogenase (short-subunit alcohol dehydrogenase family)